MKMTYAWLKVKNKVLRISVRKALGRYSVHRPIYEACPESKVTSRVGR